MSENDSITTSGKNAKLLKKWLDERGGINVWRSIDLSDPGVETFTPGDRTEKPHWKFADKPALTITDPAKVFIVDTLEVKRFHVAVRLGAQGMTIKCTDVSTARVRKEVANAGGDAWYEFDYETQEAVIYKPGVNKLSLLDYLARKNDLIEVSGVNIRRGNP